MDELLICSFRLTVILVDCIEKTTFACDEIAKNSLFDEPYVTLANNFKK